LHFIARNAEMRTPSQKRCAFTGTPSFQTAETEALSEVCLGNLKCESKYT
jgi:hypothetical protein